MLPVTPSVIPEPFAEHGAKNVIPAESPGASEPNASWTQGFPPVTMLNKQAGGKPPLGQDFNGILNALSQHLFFTQSGCVYPWMGADEVTGFPGLNYLGGSHVLGSDLKEYIAVHPSGPDVPQTGGGYVGPKDPVTDTEHLYWRPEVTSADIPEFDGVTIREINGKYGVPNFTAPTASAPGKAGLVPGPSTIPPALQPLRILGANAVFNPFRAGSFDITWERADSNDIVLGMAHLGASATLESIKVAGSYYCDNWTDAPWPGAGIYELRELRSMAENAEDLRTNFALFFSVPGKRVYLRGATAARTAGAPFLWTPWTEVLTSFSGGSYAPIPNGSGGVGWMIGRMATANGFDVLPAGGTWACYFSGNIYTGMAKTGGFGFFAGGTRPAFGGYQFSGSGTTWPECAWCWRVY